MGKSSLSSFKPSIDYNEPPGFVYAISPIDFRWPALSTIDEVRRNLAVIEADGNDSPEEAERVLADFEASWAFAQELARAKDWEGDFRGEVFVFWVPVELSFSYGFVWKQDNNGTTFVVSPIPMRHLEELE